MRVSPQPISQQSYRNAPFPFVFTFKDGEDPMDLSVFTNIQVKYFTLVNQESPEILLESGDGLTVDSNTVSGQLTAEQTLSLYNKVIYFEWIFWTNDKKMIPVNGRHIVSNVPEGAKGSDATISIVDNKVTVESVGIISIAQAILAKDAAETARDDAQTAATNAETSAQNASTSETNAEGSATTATEQAGIATTQAGIATTQAELAEAEADKVINALVQLGLVNQAHRDYTFAIIAQGGEINDPISNKELFES